MNIAFSVDVERDLKTSNLLGITSGLAILEKLLDKYKIKATFFVVAELLILKPEIFLSLKRKGHEIALHSYNHKRYDQLSISEKSKDLAKSVKVYLNLFKANPKGFRAPQHSIDQDSFKLLKKFNFIYDSSNVPGNALLFRHLIKKTKKLEILGNFFSKMKVYKKQGVLEIPSPAFLFSVDSFGLKLYPMFFVKILVFLHKLFKIPFIFNIHSWDLIETKGSKINYLTPQKKFLEKLDKFLAYTSKRFRYTKLANFSKNE
jgi:hypothetical protein